MGRARRGAPGVSFGPVVVLDARRRAGLRPGRARRDHERRRLRRDRRMDERAAASGAETFPLRTATAPPAGVRRGDRGQPERGARRSGGHHQASRRRAPAHAGPTRCPTASSRTAPNDVFAALRTGSAGSLRPARARLHGRARRPRPRGPRLRRRPADRAVAGPARREAQRSCRSAAASPGTCRPGSSGTRGSRRRARRSRRSPASRPGGPSPRSRRRPRRGSSASPRRGPRAPSRA